METAMLDTLGRLTKASRKGDTAEYRISILEELVVEHKIVAFVFEKVLALEKGRYRACFCDDGDEDKAECKCDGSDCVGVQKEKHEGKGLSKWRKDVS
jgi:hypothetical protein